MKPLALRMKDSCRVTGLGKTKTYELINEGILTRVKIGRATLITMESIEALIAQSKVESE